MTDVDMDVLARQAIAEKAVLEVAKTMHEETREAMAEVLRRGDKIQVWSPDETTDMGYVQMTKPKPAMKVTGPDELLAWVEKTYPDEVEEFEEVVVTRRVRPAFQQALVKAGGVTGDGEVVPGIEEVQVRPQLKVVVTEEAKALAVRSVRELGADAS